MLTTAEKNLKFEGKLVNIFSKDTPRVLKGLDAPRLVTFRVNTLKYSSDISALEREYPAIFTPKVLADSKQIPQFLQNTYAIDIAKKSVITSSKLYSDGVIYIQGLSSMLPPLVAFPHEEEKVLDLCAAPGSKTSLLASISNNGAHITAVDNNISRLNAMKTNLETLGVENVHFLRADSASLTENPVFINIFDKVICDVPCSNEGLIRTSDESSFTYWNPKLAEHLSKLQRRILFSGIQALKPGGVLVYSTCTFSPEENEAVVDWVLAKFPYIRIEKLDFQLENQLPGLTHYKKHQYNPEVSKALRILPNNLWDGFFIAKLFRPVSN